MFQTVATDSNEPFEAARTLLGGLVAAGATAGDFDLDGLDEEVVLEFLLHGYIGPCFHHTDPDTAITKRATAVPPSNGSHVMKPKTADLWAKQDQHQGDRWRLFSAVAEAIDAKTVFYPGCYVDISPSFVFDSVTYLDTDKRAPGFFADTDGVAEIIAAHNGPAEPDISFIHGDYTSSLDLPDEHFDLLVSLYAGFISEHCTQHLRVGGTLLVSPSHGDAAMASIDPRYELSGVVISRSGDYRVDTTDLDDYLIPKKPQDITAASLHESCRGVGYTKSPFSYLFIRTE